MITAKSQPITPVPPLKEKQLFSNFFIALLVIWFLINVAQSVFTQLGHDEAYYWMYAKRLDWGYFDHPPLVALFVKLSGSLFSGELGVRFVTIISQIIVLCLLWHLIDEKEPAKKKVILFFGIAAAIVMFQVYGFITTPDAPLIFFTTFFLFVYRKFIESNAFANIVLLALAMAGLMYSKYQGGLVILLVLLSNIKLLANPRFWISGCVALLLFVPHILWQIDNDFPSFKFHLVQRSKPFSFKNVLEFWTNQMAAFNPFILGVVLYIILKFKPKDLFERALYFIIYGFLVFFWLTSIRGRVQPQWTIAACIPMIILVYQKSVENRSIRKYVYRIVFPSLILLLMGRLALIFDFLPIKLEFHGQKQWAKSIERIAENTPVIFFNSYQKPSVYSFYTHKPAFTLNSVYYRKNQFDIWEWEEKLHNKKAVLISYDFNDSSGIEYTLPGNQKIRAHFVNNLLTIQKMVITYTLPSDKLFKKGKLIAVPVEIYNPYPYPIYFNHKEFPISFSAVFSVSKKMVMPVNAITDIPINYIDKGETIKTTIHFVTPDFPKAACRFNVSLKAGIQQEAFNSNFEWIKIQ